MRLVVSFLSTLPYWLCEYLNRWINNNIPFQPRFSLQNTSDLVEIIRDPIIPDNSLLISFDVVSLYTNVPLDPTFDYIDQLLSKTNINSSSKEEFISFLLQTCLQSNICQFQNRIHEFKDGLLMESLLYSLLANIFMDSLVLSSSLKVKRFWECFPRFWFLFRKCVDSGPKQIDIYASIFCGSRFIKF